MVAPGDVSECAGLRPGLLAFSQEAVNCKRRVVSIDYRCRLELADNGAMRKVAVWILSLCILSFLAGEVVDAIRPPRPDVELIINAALCPRKLEVWNPFAPSKPKIEVSSEWVEPGIALSFEEILKLEVKKTSEEEDFYKKQFSDLDKDDKIRGTQVENYLHESESQIVALTKIQNATPQHNSEQILKTRFNISVLKLDSQIRVVQTNISTTSVYSLSGIAILSLPVFSGDRHYAILKATYFGAKHPGSGIFFLERGRGGWHVVVQRFETMITM